jgi:hypothetical protein
MEYIGSQMSAKNMWAGIMKNGMKESKLINRTMANDSN